MSLVDKQDDRGVRALDLVNHGLQALFEFALDRRSGLHQADIQHMQVDIAQLRWNIPRAKRWANPSTTAVLPTPASPVRIGLFCLRRIRISMIWRISASRPTTGSIAPSRARCVRLVAYFSSDDFTTTCGFARRFSYTVGFSAFQRCSQEVVKL